MTSKDPLIDELNYVARKMDHEIARLKSWGPQSYDESAVRAIQARRDAHYERLCQIDGLTSELTG